MTSAADVVAGVFPPRPSDTPQVEAHREAKAYPRSERAAGSRLSAVVPTLAKAGRTVATDVRSAWPWAGHPPTLAELWAARIPDVDAVPGGSAVLRAAWAVWNHLLLLPVAAAYVALWVLAHPARALLAAAVAVPSLLIWI